MEYPLAVRHDTEPLRVKQNTKKGDGESSHTEAGGGDGGVQAVATKLEEEKVREGSLGVEEEATCRDGGPHGTSG